MAELASSSAEQPASKFTFDVNLETNEVEVKYKGNPTWTHITKWNFGVVPATDDLQIDKELRKIKTLQKTFHDNLRVTLTRIRNRIHCILFVFGHDNLDSAFQMAIQVDRIKATISEFLQEIDPNLKNSSLSCWVGEQNESSEQDNENSDEKSESIVFSVTDNRKGCTSETDWSCSFGHDEFEIDLTSSRTTFTKLKSMFQNSYRCFLKLVRRGSLIIECEHESREDALEMMKNHVKVKATILECLHEMDPRVNAIKIEVEYREMATPTPARSDPGADRNLRDASRKGNMEAVKRILAAGRADINCRDEDGKTPVMWAAWWRHRDVVEILVNEGADVSLVNKSGNNMLHFACWGGDVETVKFVLSLKVDIDARNNAGLRAADVAKHWGHKKVVELL